MSVEERNLCFRPVSGIVTQAAPGRPRRYGSDHAPKLVQMR